MKIALIYNKDNQATTGAYIENVFIKREINYVHFWTQEFRAISGDFDLYLRIDHGDYKYDILPSLHPAVFYVIDTHLEKPYKKIRKQINHYDIVFCAQKQGAERLRKEVKIDAQWIPLGCDPEVHKKLDIPKDYDIGFVGNEASKFSRSRQLKLLRKRYPHSFIGEAYFREMAKIYSASRVGFNSSIINDINMRIFEIMSCGCFLLTNEIKNNGLEELFAQGKHLVTYKNDRHLIKLIEHYLNNENEREKIAEEGRKLVLEKHTYFHRVQAMFNYIAFKFGGKYNGLRI